MVARLVLDSGNVAPLLQRCVIFDTTAELQKVLSELRTALPVPEVEETATPLGTEERALIRLESNSPFQSRENLQSAVTDDDEFDITLKLFFGDGVQAETVRDAITQCHRRIDSKSLDSTIMSLPQALVPALGGAEDVAPVTAQLWTALTADKTLSSHFGVADFGATQIEWLIKETGIAPAVDQVNLTDCCVIPTDLVSFTKENNISLLTHADPKTLLSTEGTAADVQALVAHAAQAGALARSAGGGDANATSTIAWIGRYSAMVRSRGIVSHTGYIIGIE